MTDRRLKVVAHLLNGNLVKGYFDDPTASDIETLASQGRVSLPPTIRVQQAGSGEITTVLFDALKALFFVRSFEGKKEYSEIKFFDTHPSVNGIWVRLKYYDNEVMEGVVFNSLHHLVEPGFLLKPPDPRSNNEIVYVRKASLVDFRVLGVRNTY